MPRHHCSSLQLWAVRAPDWRGETPVAEAQHIGWQLHARLPQRQMQQGRRGLLSLVHCLCGEEVKPENCTQGTMIELLLSCMGALKQAAHPSCSLPCTAGGK